MCLMITKIRKTLAVITTAQLHLKNLNSGSTQAQILYTTWRRPVMVIASDYGLGGKQFYTSFFCQPFHTHKKNYRHHHCHHQIFWRIVSHCAKLLLDFFLIVFIKFMMKPMMHHCIRNQHQLNAVFTKPWQV